ncbi:uncharacterized protein RJT21DRAFT_14596 [Scheffersomyces amazonensis]|uniref:uncharacterized protein n=1 Tax=Scheffersomyces amazonensis TaxID=1078765 RepID=UPI00315D3F00
MSQFDELINPKVPGAPKSTKKDLPNPPGFAYEAKGTNNSKSKKSTVSSTVNEEERLEELKEKKAWEVAIGPAKSIPMNAIMSYMTGNSLQIIPVTMTLMLLWNPLKAIFNETNPNFINLTTKKNGTTILLAKAVFILFQILNMSIGIYKLYKMGLIPHTEADWIAWKEIKDIKERLSS